jgi:hypothetical protein
LHLLYGLFKPQQGALAAKERQGLEEAGAYGAPGRGEAEGVYEVARSLLFLGGETSNGLLGGFFRPLREGPQAFQELREGFSDELLA